jgi:hypothetical protein
VLLKKQSFHHSTLYNVYSRKSGVKRPRNEHNHPTIPRYVTYSVSVQWTRTKTAEHTCYLPLSQTPPELLGLPQRPSLNLGAKTAEELIILKVRHIQRATLRTAQRRCMSPTDDAPVRTPEARRRTACCFVCGPGTWQLDWLTHQTTRANRGSSHATPSVTSLSIAVHQDQYVHTSLYSVRPAKCKSLQLPIGHYSQLFYSKTIYISCSGYSYENI